MIPDRRRPSSYLAAGRSALAHGADAAAHLRSLRADPARLSDRGISAPTSTACGVVKSVYVQTNWSPRSAYEDEAAWVQRTADRDGLAARDRRLCRRRRADDVRPQLDRLARYPLCAACACNCTGTRTRNTASPRGRTSPRIPEIQRNIGRLADYGLSFDLQVFAPQMADAADLAEVCARRSRSCFSTRACSKTCRPPDARNGAQAWCRLAACPNVSTKLSGLGTFLHRNDPAHVAEIVRETVGDVRRRSVACSARTFRSRSCGPRMRELLSSLSGTPWRRSRPRNSRRSCTTRRCASIESRHRAHNGTRKLGGNHAAGNQDSRLWRHRAGIELPCARPRLRAHAPRADAGLSDPRRRLSDCRRHRLPLEPDHGDAGHARAAVPREHDREPARQARRAHGRRPLRAAHPPAHRSRRQGRSVSDELDRGRQSQGARIFGLRPACIRNIRRPTSSI